jgi:hypothetical protein
MVSKYRYLRIKLSGASPTVIVAYIKQPKQKQNKAISIVSVVYGLLKMPHNPTIRYAIKRKTGTVRNRKMMIFSNGCSGAAIIS